jgi:hypothetical protein
MDERMLNHVRADLLREIPSEIKALERVGFLFVQIDKAGAFAPASYMSVAEEDYLDPPIGYGAYYSGRAINKAISRILRTKEFVFTIHIHDGFGEPSPSRADMNTEKILIECFSRIIEGPHGSIILSEDSGLIRAWNSDLQVIEKIDSHNLSQTEEEK